MKQHFNTNQLIVAVSIIGAAYTVLSPILTYQQYKTIASISPAFIHIPLSLFGAIASILTLEIDKRFSVIACLFVVMNGVLV